MGECMSEWLLMVPIQNELLQSCRALNCTSQGDRGKNLGLVLNGAQ